MKNYEIMPINLDHFEGFRAAVGSVARERKYLSFIDEPDPEMSRAFAAENIENNWPHFVAICEGKVVGWCDISSLNRPVFAHAGTLGMGVVTGFRGIGIGKALMSAALQKAKEIGLTRVELTVRGENETAIAMYKKFGFLTEGLHINAVRIDERYENLISMALLFELR